MDSTNLKFLTFTGVIVTIILAGFILLAGTKPAQDKEETFSTEEVKEMLLDNPRQDRYNELGPEDAIMVIVEFSDFQCPFCSTVSPELEAFAKANPEDVRFVYRHFPLTSIHQYAYRSALAVETAGQYGHFWEMHDKMMNTQDAWSSSDEEGFYSLIEEYAKEIGIQDVTSYMNDVKSEKSKDIIEKDLKTATSLDLGGTPSVFVNGQLVEDRSTEALQQILDSLKQTE